ncbi:MAG: SDR family NAD(P)-dependent oxidoreductase [Aureliella sp.]
MQELQWKGKRAVVCGATAGLGRAFAIELARQQVQHLTLVARSSVNLQTLRRELLGQFASLDVVCLPADLCVKEQLQLAVEQLHQTGLGVDLVVQAVGQSDRGRLVDLSSQRLHELIGANVLSSLHAVQCFHPLMRKAGGNIVLIGSLASLFAPRFLGGYAIAKHGLAALAQQARLELAEDGIHVLLACPGPIARDDSGARYDQQARSDELPDAARRPGAGAKIRGLDSQRLVHEILRAAAAKQPRIIRPRKANLLLWLSALSTSLGDRLLRKNSG